MKEKLKNRKNIIISLILCISLIGSVFAFMMSTDELANTFNIGNVRVRIHEDSWYDSNGNLLHDTNGNGINDLAESLTTGTELDKDPTFSNEGTTDAWLFSVVKIPTATKAQIADLDDDNSIGGTNQTVTVYSYAFQEGYKDAEDAEEAWYAFFNGTDASDVDYTSKFGTETSDTSDRYRLFILLNVDTTNWTQVQAYHSTDGYDYLIYKYNTALEKGDETDPLFTKIKLNSSVGDPRLLLAYYIPEPESVAGAFAELELPAEEDIVASCPDYEGYQVYAAAYYQPNDSIKLMDGTAVNEGQFYEWTDVDGNGVDDFFQITEDTCLFYTGGESFETFETPDNVDDANVLSATLTSHNADVYSIYDDEERFSNFTIDASPNAKGFVMFTYYENTGNGTDEYCALGKTSTYTFALNSSIESMIANPDDYKYNPNKYTNITLNETKSSYSFSHFTNTFLSKKRSLNDPKSEPYYCYALKEHIYIGLFNAGKIKESVTVKYSAYVLYDHEDFPEYPTYAGYSYVPTNEVTVTSHCAHSTTEISLYNVSYTSLPEANKIALTFNVGSDVQRITLKAYTSETEVGSGVTWQDTDSNVTVVDNGDGTETWTISPLNLNQSYYKNVYNNKYQLISKRSGGIVYGNPYDITITYTAP